jgi:integrase
MPLTDLQCKNAAAREKPYKMADTGGLYLHIMPNGRKYWRMKYVFDKKERLLTFGPYPSLSLQEARFKRDDAQKLRRDGFSPAEIKQERKRAEIETARITFEVVAREWHGHNRSKWTPNYGQDILHRLETDIFPTIGGLPIHKIRAADVLGALRKIEDRGANEMARRTKQYCDQIFRYAVITGKVEHNPLPDLRDALKPVKHGHFAAINPEDIPAFLSAADDNRFRIYPQTRRAMKLMMLTFVRTSDLIEAPWEEIDFDNATWIIKANRMKIKDRPDHVVPLSTQALAILREQKESCGKSTWVFPNQAHPRDPMSNGAILSALKRIGYKGKMTGHGFRALAMSTIKEKLGYRHEVVDRQLAHMPKSKIDAAYDRAKFLDERRRMMQEWADYLDRAKKQGMSR